MKEDYHFSRELFDEKIDPILKGNTTSHCQYTYIARKGDENIYKIGMSRNPTTRGKMLGGRYRGFKVLYFLESNIEHDMHLSVLHAGARYAFKNDERFGLKEAFIISQDDIEHIIKHCGFRPISEFDKTCFDGLFEKEVQEHYQIALELGYIKQ